MNSVQSMRIAIIVSACGFLIAATLFPPPASATTCPAGDYLTGVNTCCPSGDTYNSNGSCNAPMQCPLGYTYVPSIFQCNFTGCPSGYVAQLWYLNAILEVSCVPASCPAGYSGTYPNCI